MRTLRNINLKKILSLFLQQPADPLFNAKGAAIGIFLGCFPFVGFQTIVGVFIAEAIAAIVSSVVTIESISRFVIDN